MALNEKQRKAAEALATRGPDEEIREVEKRAGVSKATLWRYRQNEEFRKAVEGRIAELTWGERGPILRALMNKAKGGDVQATRLFFQWRGELTEKHEVNQTLREVTISERAAGASPK